MQSIYEAADYDVCRLRYSLSTCGLDDVSSFESSLIKNKYLDLNFEKSNHRSVNFTTPKVNSLDNYDVLQELGSGLESLVIDSVDSILEGKFEEEPSSERERWLCDNLVYQPLTDTSLEIFLKVSAYYTLFPILAKRNGLTSRHEQYQNYLPEDFITKNIYFHAVRLCSEELNKILNLYYLEKFKLKSKENYESGNYENRTLSSVGLPAGSFVFVNNTEELLKYAENAEHADNLEQVLTKQFTNTTSNIEKNRTLNLMHGPRKAFFHTIDGKWIQIIAFSNDSKIIQPFKNLALALKSQNIHYKHRTFLPIKYPKSSIEESFYDKLMISGDDRDLRGRTGDKASMKAKGLDVAVSKKQSRLMKENEEKRDKEIRGFEEVSLFPKKIEI